MQLQSFKMANRETFNSILFNNKLYHKRSSNKAVCLNPLCSEMRLFELQGGKELEQHKDHLGCKGWICSLDKLTKRFQEPIEGCIQSQLEFDFLEEPINAILKSQSLSQIRWEDSLFKCFDTIQKNVEAELTRIYIKYQRQINDHIDRNKEISSKIKAFCEEISTGWQESHGFIYNQYLKNDLSAIQKKGKISMSNIGMLERRFGSIINQVKKVEQSIWNDEPEYDLQNRLELRLKKQELINNTKLSTEEINQKIQEIQNTLKGKIKFFEGKEAIEAYCFRCPAVLKTSQGKNTKIRKQQCRQLIVNHFCTVHMEPILNKFTKNIPIKLSVAGLIKEIETKKIKNVVVIDKENMVFNSNIFSSYEDLYAVEILSKNSENIAKGRHLIAESKGKDAADILIIIVLYELGKLNLNQITLLTNDHYGETMQPIFLSLGVNIKIKNKEDVINAERY